jgi:glycosyltransferase involved in cell wall biosynthesis
VALVSVIIPTHNRAAWVAQAAASVLSQTFRDFELLVVDDGSTDGTLEALAPFSGRLKLLKQRGNRGVSAARNLGIAAAQGEWLALLDSDDLWLKDKLTRQMAYLKDHPGLLICQTEEIWVRHGIRVNPPVTHRKVGGRIFEASLKRCMVSPSAVMLHRRLLEEVGLFDEALPAAEDYDLWLRVAWRHVIGLVPQHLVVKRGGHPDQLSRAWGLDRWRIAALRKILQEPELPKPYRLAARRTLAEKCRIYARGCEKRGKVEEAPYYRKLMEQMTKTDAVPEKIPVTGHRSPVHAKEDLWISTKPS